MGDSIFYSCQVGSKNYWFKDFRYLKPKRSSVTRIYLMLQVYSMWRNYRYVGAGRHGPGFPGPLIVWINRIDHSFSVSRDKARILASSFSRRLLISSNASEALDTSLPGISQIAVCGRRFIFSERTSKRL